MNRMLVLFVVMALGLAPKGWAQPAAPELGRIPANAIGVAHFRWGTLYKSESFKELRDFVAMAGPQAMRTLEQRFKLTPFHIDRVTLVALAPIQRENGPGVSVAIMVSTLEDIPGEDLAKSFDLEKVKDGDATYPAWMEKNTGYKLALPKPRLALFGATILVDSLGKNQEGGAPALFAQLANHDVGLVVQPKAIPRELLGLVPPPFSEIVNAEVVKLQIDLGKEAKLAAQVQYGSENSAKAVEELLKSLAQMGLVEIEKSKVQLQQSLEKPGGIRPAPFSELPEALGALYGLAALNDYAQYLKNPPLLRKGDTLLVEMKATLGGQMTVVAVVAVGVGLLLPAVQKVRAAANRSTSSNNLKQMALAMHNFNDAMVQVPNNLTDKKSGKPLLSWRVAILPYLEQGDLYNQFKLDEPWDSEHNLKLAKIAVKTYSQPGVEPTRDSQGNGLTPYQGLAGPSTLFEPGKKIRFNEITDGMSNTILFVEAKNQVIWTKPEDVPFDPKRDLPPTVTLFGGLTPGGFNAAFADGSVRFIADTVDRKTIKAMITRNGNEPMGVR